MTSIPDNKDKKLASKIQIYSLLAIVLVGGFLLRTWNVNFDRGIGSHPDERSTACFYATTISLPASWDEFWNPRQSPLNPLWDREHGEPRSFTYGHFPLYLGVATGNVLKALSPAASALLIPVHEQLAPRGFPPLDAPESIVGLMQRADSSCDALAVAGRLTIALLDTITIFLLFLLGALIFNRTTGLIAASLYAATAQAIQLSHFFAMDPASTTFTVLAVLAAVRFVLYVRARDIVLLGVSIGLAVSSKFSALPILALPVVASLLIWVRTGSGRAARQSVGAARFWAIVAFPLVIALSSVTFLVTSPYAVLDWQQFIQVTLVEQGRMVRGIADFPYTRQYRDTTPYLYFITEQLRWGMWWPLGMMAIAGGIVSLVLLLIPFGTGPGGAQRAPAVHAIARNVLHVMRRSNTAISAVELSKFDSYFFASRQESNEKKLESKTQVGLIIIWSWVLPYFGITGAFLAKFNRYMSPVLPFLALFAAGIVYWLWALSQSDRVKFGGQDLAFGARVEPGPISRRLLLWSSWLVAVVTIGGTIFWSTAYVYGVYGHEHTWITASRWIYEHAPRGSVILWELWDDPLPKAIPGEPGMDMGAHDLRNIDWGPYEEDTFQKYETLKAKLREADYVVYSSKRIYDSVDELPERYPMTLIYYDAMWDGRMGFELVAEITSPPRLFGLEFDDRHADESWSLYDHPQVSIFEKKRELTDAEFDALFQRAWERAEPYYRGEESALAPLLKWLGLGRSPDSEHVGLLNYVIALVSDRPEVDPIEGVGARKSLMLDRPLHELPVVDDYRWNDWASNSTLASVLVWWIALTALGWAVWPLCFVLFPGLRDRGFLVSKTVGWLLSGWLLWSLVSYGLAINSVRNTWLAFAVITVVGLLLAVRAWRSMVAFVGSHWKFLAISEILVALAFLFVIGLRLNNPDLWQPWFGGEKFMEFAFLNGILRSPTFPPVDPHFAGGYINYYYFGLYLSSFLIKLTGIYAEVAFNLLIATLFALAFANAYAIAYSVGATAGKPWNHRLVTALIAPIVVLLFGNLDAFGQIVRGLSQRVGVEMQSVFALPVVLVNAAIGLVRVVLGAATLPGYDFWAPSRVLPNTINEFPFWSFLFADLHPHLIGIPLSLLFLYVAFAALRGVRAKSYAGRDIPHAHDASIQFTSNWRPEGSPRSVGVYDADLHATHREATWHAGRVVFRIDRIAITFALTLAFMLGTLASVNLWELPTFFAIGLLVTAVRQYRRYGAVRWPSLWLFGVVFLAGAYLFYYPFFANYVNIGAGGVGIVKSPDDLGVWLLVWGFFVFVLASWLVLEFLRPAKQRDPEGSPARIHSNAVERLIGLILRHYDRMPRLFRLHARLVQDTGVGYLFGVLFLAVTVVAVIVTLLTGYAVLAICIAGAVLSLILIWHFPGRCRLATVARSERALVTPSERALVTPLTSPADAGTTGESRVQFIAILSLAGFSILGGTQIVFLRDFLQGGDWYRMNTIFKFYIQVWVLWGIASALALPVLWSKVITGHRAHPVARELDNRAHPVARELDNGGDSNDESSYGQRRDSVGNAGTLARTWTITCVLLVSMSMAYPLCGTPARLSQRLVGWQPPFGTLNGLDYMRRGSYTWPDSNNTIELRYDYDAIRWLLDNVRGNTVVVEAAEVDYYRAGGTRVASLTGLSGLRGMHESEQRYGDILSARETLHREFWSTTDVQRTLDIIQELHIGLIYVGPLERQLHAQAMEKLDTLAAEGEIYEIYQNSQVTIYAVTGRMTRTEDGWFVPTAVGPTRTLGQDL